MATYAAKSPDTGNVYEMSSKAEHVRLLAQGYRDATEPEPAQQPVRRSEPRPPKPVDKPVESDQS